MADQTVQFVLSELPDDDEIRKERLSEAISDQLLPALAEAAHVSSAELAAHALVDLAYIVGFTHRSEDSLALLSAVAEALRSGMADYAEEAAAAGDGDSSYDEDWGLESAGSHLRH
jgi:hypothetical protein